MPPLDIVSVGASYSPGAYSPDTGPAGALKMAAHRFSAGADGQLEHYIDGALRARVPPEGWDDYERDWPACGALVSQLKRPAAVPAAEGDAQQ